MREFIISCMAVVLVALVVEIFCPAKVMKKSLYMALSLVTLVVISSGINGLLSNKSENPLDNLSLNLEASSDSVFVGMVESTEQQILLSLNENGIDCKSVKLDYYVDELSIKYVSAKVKLKEIEEEEKVKEIVSNLTGLKVEDVTIYE